MEYEVSELAKGYGFDDQREFDDYCDDMEKEAKTCEQEG